MMKWLKRIFISSVILPGIFLLALFLNYKFVTEEAASKIVYHIDSLQPARVGLVLGTSKYSVSGTINSFYRNRINAALQLFEAGKVEYLIVSGDNRHASYNEPRFMMRDLIDAGVPSDRIIPDYAGFRTFDSMVRAKKVFMLDSVILISQVFHLERALFIAQRYKLRAIGFAADFPDSEAAFKVVVREYFARIRMMLDLYILKTEPHFLGEEIPVLPKDSV
ncbi:MAG TPA: ElyC/SanA/YdcF family protein [Bacteroidales bacterium]|jgi:SanA protein|nr:ElyC/SanA/YdcF family protein [Bacteroidales bacterium]MDY0085606.1 ElyC/SanA/YdcF family protein [Bacteroidales bacterium]HPE43219.1 ElyC/SanA/YdcF family protein [Bacteroidales bacterium]